MAYIDLNLDNIGAKTAKPAATIPLDIPNEEPSLREKYTNYAASDGVGPSLLRGLISVGEQVVRAAPVQPVAQLLLPSQESIDARKELLTAKRNAVVLKSTNQLADTGKANIKAAALPAYTQKPISKMTTQELKDTYAPALLETERPFDGQTAFNRAGRGATAAVVSLGNALHLGDAEKNKFILQDIARRDEEYKIGQMTDPVRVAEYEAVKKQMADAKTPMQTVKASLAGMYDSVTHPSDANIAGFVGGTLGDVSNLALPAFAAKVGGMFTGKVAAVSAGALADGLFNGAVGAAQTYSNQRRQGMSHDDALKASIANAVPGVLMGAAIGAPIGGMSAKVIAPKVDTIAPELKPTTNDSAAPAAVARVTARFDDNPIVDANIADAALEQIHSVTHAAEMDAQANYTKRQAAIDDQLRAGADIDTAVAKAAEIVPPTENELHMSSVWNDGQTGLPANLQGFGIISSLQKTIDSSLHSAEDFANVLNKYPLAEDVKTAALHAYEQKDIAPFTEYLTTKIAAKKQPELDALLNNRAFERIDEMSSARAATDELMNARAATAGVSRQEWDAANGLKVVDYPNMSKPEVDAASANRDIFDSVYMELNDFKAGQYQKNTLGINRDVIERLDKKTANMEPLSPAESAAMSDIASFAKDTGAFDRYIAAKAADTTAKPEFVYDMGRQEYVPKDEHAALMREADMLFSKEENKPNFELVGDPVDLKDPKNHQVFLNVEKWVRDTAGISDKTISTNLTTLLQKHPKMFENEADVFRLIKEVKDNPTHFLRATNPDNTILAKTKDDGALKAIGIQKDGGFYNIVVHATDRNSPRDTAREFKRQTEGSPTPSLSTSETVAGAKAHSSAVGDSIPQSSKISQDEIVHGVYEKLSTSHVITTFKSANFATVMHEYGHYFRRTLSPEERAAAEAAFGVEKGEWSVAKEEEFAHAFVKWLGEGREPTTLLEGVFAKMKSFLVDIFTKNPKSHEAMAKLDDRQREFFSALFGDTEAAKKIYGEMEVAAKERDVLYQKEQPQLEGLATQEAAGKDMTLTQENLPGLAKAGSRQDIREAVETRETRPPEEWHGYKQIEKLENEPGMSAKIKESLMSLREAVQDNWAKVESEIAAREKNGEKLSDEADPYLARTLYDGRVQAKMDSVKEIMVGIVDGIKEISDKYGNDFAKTKALVNSYLHAKHAPERNAAMFEGAAGMSSEGAKQIHAIIENLPFAEEIKAVAANAAKLNEMTLDILKDGQVIEPKLYEQLRAKYKEHVPLNRIMEDEGDNTVQALAGSGIGAPTTGIKTAKGSSLEVHDILGNIQANVSQATLRAEKNRVTLSLIKYIDEAKDGTPLFTNLGAPKAIGMAHDGKTPIMPTKPENVIVARVNGKPVWIQINDKTLAGAMNGMGINDMHIFIKTLGAITRLWSSMLTRNNVEFWIDNIKRDIQEAILYNLSRMGFKGAAKALGNQPLSVKYVYDAMANKKGSEGARIYKEMVDAGGTTGGLSLSTREDIFASLGDLEKIANSKPRQALEKVVNFIDKANKIFEDSTRLAAYIAAKDKGMSIERAAQHAKEVTINFNKKGNATSAISAVYMFANPSIQGNYKTFRIAKDSPKVAIASIATLTAITIGNNAYNDMVDPDWREKTNEYDRKANLVIVLGHNEDGSLHYTNFTLTHSLRPIKTLIDNIYDSFTGKGDGALAAFANVVGSAWGSYNPVGGSDIGTVFPTIFRPFVDVRINESWNGSKIHPDNKEKLPKKQQHFPSTGNTTKGEMAITVSNGLHKVNIHVRPDDIMYVMGQYGGGAPSVATDTLLLPFKAMSDKPVDVKEIPIVRRHYKETTPDRFEKNKKEKAREELIKKVSEADAPEEQKQLARIYIDALPEEDRKKEAYILLKGGIQPTKKEREGGMGINIRPHINIFKD